MPLLNQKCPSDQEMRTFINKYIRICKIIIFIMILIITFFIIMLYSLLINELYPAILWGIMVIGIGIFGLQMIPDKKDHLTAKLYAKKLDEKYNAH